MRGTGLAGAMLLAVGVAGCVAPPPAPVYAVPAQAEAPLVAAPGPGKTEAAFQADDRACRADVERLPKRPAAQPTPAQLQAAQAAEADPNVPPPPPDALPPGAAFLRCMTARGNQVQPLQAEALPAYGYLPAYPVHAEVGYGYPFFYDDVFLLRYYGGFGHRGYGFGRFGHGYRVYPRYGYGGRFGGGYGRSYYGGGYGRGFGGGFGHGGFGHGGFGHGGFGRR